MTPAEAAARRLQDMQHTARVALDWLDPNGRDDDLMKGSK